MAEESELFTHRGRLCESGSRAVDLALELGRARLQAELDRQRILELEALVRVLRKHLTEAEADLARIIELEALVHDLKMRRKTPPVSEETAGRSGADPIPSKTPPVPEDGGEQSTQPIPPQVMNADPPLVVYPDADNSSMVLGFRPSGSAGTVFIPGR